MPLIGEAKKEYQRKLMKERRSNTKGLTEEGLTSMGLTEYHPILYALTDPVKRKKLEDICLSLKRRNLGGVVYYGMKHPVDFLVIGDLLEATERN